PAIGRAVSKHRDAYTYLPESVLEFPDPDAFARRLSGAGFGAVGYELLTGGICALHHGTRLPPRPDRGDRGAGGPRAHRSPGPDKQRDHRNRRPLHEVPRQWAGSAPHAAD